MLITREGRNFHGSCLFVFYSQNDLCIRWITASKWTLFSSKEHGGPFKFLSQAKLYKKKLKRKKKKKKNENIKGVL